MSETITKSMTSGPPPLQRSLMNFQLYNKSLLRLIPINRFEDKSLLGLIPGEIVNLYNKSLLRLIPLEIVNFVSSGPIIKGFTISFFLFLFLFKHLIDYCIFINLLMYVFFRYLAQMLFGWNLTVENTTFSSILIRWTNLTNVLNRNVRHYIVFLNRRNNSVTLHQIVNGDRLTTEINGLTQSTNYSVEVVGIDTVGKPYKTPSEVTITTNRKRGNASVCLFCLFVCFFFY